MSVRRFVVAITAVLALSVLLCASSVAGNWPQYRYDGARGGVSPETLQPALHPQWVYQAQHAPRPAWPEPGRELHRMPFDYAPQVTVADGLVYSGSSADHKVYALDLSTGLERWSFFTGGPVRFAPAVANGRVFVASDDGWLYCLAAPDGKLLWRFLGGPRREKLMGNEQMVSRWPLRSGVAVEGDTVYLTAGMWPAEGIYAYALNAADGKVIWRNDTSGSMYINEPHPPSAAMSGVAPQGYAAVKDGRLSIPTGRNVPACYDAKTGRLLYYHARPDSWGNRWGGSWQFLWADRLIIQRGHVGADLNVVIGESDPWPKDGLAIFDAKTGRIKLELDAKLHAVISKDTMYASGGGKVTAYDVKALMAGKKAQDCVKWETDHARAYTLVMAGNTLLVGGKGTVTAIDATSGKVLWTEKVDGEVRALAAADGRVIAGMTSGAIACFGPEALAKVPTMKTTDTSAAYADDVALKNARETAGRILTQTGVSKGYCVIADAIDGRLASELARQSELQVWCAIKDAKAAQSARRALDATGVYGIRVTVHTGWLKDLRYPAYLADLVVVGDGTPRPVDAEQAAELYRILRPVGGIAYLTAKPGGKTAAVRIRRSLVKAGVPAAEIEKSKVRVQIVRAPLPTAGAWTHQYANAARTGCSEDACVKLPLKLLWFGKPGPARLVSRHWAGPAPLAVNGRMFVIGQYSVTAVDAYNGRELWVRELKAAARFPIGSKGGNAVADANSVFIATGKKCVRFDAETGETINEYDLPPAPTTVGEEAAKALTWSYIAVIDDLLLGTMGNAKYGRCLFALNKQDGKTRWIYDARHSVFHAAIAAGNGKVYLIDKPTGEQFARLKRRGEKMSATSRLVALNARTGKRLWETDRGLNGRTELRLGPGVLVATGGGRMTAYRAADARMLSWSGAAMRRFPVIVGNTLYGEPYAYDLSTGKRKLRVNPLTGDEAPWVFGRSYGCGAISAGTNMIMFRSSMLGMSDLAGDSGTHNFGGVRAGCYVNAIIANGLLLMPPADAACTCSYNFQTTIALTPTQRNEDWSIFYARGIPKGARIRQMALNFGATGDKRDADGKLWLGFPRRAGLSVPMKLDIAESGGKYRRNSDELAIGETDKPWIYTSGIAGLSKAVVTLGSAEEKTYKVRLHFAELEDVSPGERIFDVKLQGNVVLEGVDVVQDAGGLNKALIKEVSGIAAADTLALELAAKAVKGKTGRLPIISGIELYEE